MQSPLKITTRDIPSSAAIEAQIQRKAEKLNKVYRHIIACHVVMDLEQKHRHQGKIYNVRIDLTVPGGELPVTRNSAENAYVAIRDAFAAARRRVEEYAELQKGDGKAGHFAKIPLCGRVVRIFSDQGYGFIETEDGDEVYFHRSVVKPAFQQLTIGLPVHFLEEMGEKGLQASRVRLSKEEH